MSGETLNQTPDRDDQKIEAIVVPDYDLRELEVLLEQYPPDDYEISYDIESGDFVFMPRR